MKPSVYIETSVLSYLTARPSRDATVAVYQDLTRRWWATAPTRFRLVVSALVFDEAGAGDLNAARDRRRAIETLPLLAPNPASRELTKQLLKLGAVPPNAESDAVHIALAAVNELDYLVTWNFRHIANATMQARIVETCRRAGHRSPIICAPPALMEP